MESLEPHYFVGTNIRITATPSPTQPRIQLARHLRKPRRRCLRRTVLVDHLAAVQALESKRLTYQQPYSNLQAPHNLPCKTVYALFNRTWAQVPALRFCAFAPLFAVMVGQHGNGAEHDKGGCVGGDLQVEVDGGVREHRYNTHRRTKADAAAIQRALLP